jgi:hypothetical protein
MNCVRRLGSVVARCSALFLLAASTNAWCTQFFAANSGGTLARFDTASPTAAPDLSVAITGLGLGESVVGIDIRPFDLKLYALTKDGSNAGRLYSVDTISGAATLVATLTPNALDAVPYTSLSGTRFAFAFNPQADRIRLITDSGLNYRINPSTGVVLHDPDLNPGTPHVVAAAYINSFHGTTATSLYDIDSNADTLLLQNPPNNGTLTTIGSGLGVNLVDLVGFDITVVGTTNFAYATALVGGNINLYSIDLVTGHATFIGGLNGNFQTVGIAIVPERIFANGFE